MTRISQPSTSSGLIVNFPNSDQPVVMKSVRFSPTCEVKVSEKSSSRKNKTKLYTGREYNLFRHQRTRDLVHCSNLMMYKSSVGESFTTEDIVKLTGFEFFVSDDIQQRMREIEHKRESHAALILGVQARWRSANRFSVTALARVSERSSEHARRLSHKVAAASFGAAWIMHSNS